MTSPGSDRGGPAPRVEQAVLLVGGKGTRLGDLTWSTPKPLMPISGDRVFLDLLLDNVARQGFREILLLAGFHGDQIMARYHKQRRRAAEIKVLIEPEPLGTSGALRFAASHLDPWFLLANGDTYFDIGYRRLEEAKRSTAASKGVVALRMVEDAARYGSVRLNGAMIVAFSEKDPHSTGVPGLINGGVYLLSRDILERMPATGAVSLETDIFPTLVRDGCLAGLPLEGYFIDIGLPETLAEARLDLPARMRRPAIIFRCNAVDALAQGAASESGTIAAMPGLFKALNAAGCFVFVMSRAASEPEIARDGPAYEERMLDRLAADGAHADAVFDLGPDDLAGAIRRLLSDWPIDPAHSMMVADALHDIDAAKRAEVDGVLFDGGDLRSLIHTRVNLRDARQT